MCYYMYMRYAIVDKNNLVDNIIEYDGKAKYNAPGTLVKIEPKQIVEIGYSYIDGKFVEPKPEKKQKDTK